MDINTVSDFRKSKWAYFFDFMDRDQDGYLTKHDFKENIESIQAQLKSTEMESLGCRREMLSWWPLYGEYADQNKGLVDKEFFVKKNAEYFASNTDIAHEVNHHFATLFRLVDKNHDGEISFDEFNLYYRAHSWRDDDKNRRVFDTLDTNKDGVISCEEFVHNYSEYFLSENPETVFLYKPS